MTTIAFRDGILAADTQGDWGGTKTVAEKAELCQKHLQHCPEPRTVDCCGVVDEHDIVECSRCGRQWTVPCSFDEDYS